MKKISLLVFVLVFAFACSKNEAPSSSGANFDPTASQNKEDPLKLGTGACKVDEKKDCDTTKK